jgi:hypothetical protein
MAGADCCADKHGTTIRNELKTTMHATRFIDGAIAFHVGVIRMIRREQILSGIDQENSIGNLGFYRIPQSERGRIFAAVAGPERSGCGVPKNQADFQRGIERAVETGSWVERNHACLRHKYRRQNQSLQKSECLSSFVWLSCGKA